MYSITWFSHFVLKSHLFFHHSLYVSVRSVARTSKSPSSARTQTHSYSDMATKATKEIHWANKSDLSLRIHQHLLHLYLMHIAFVLSIMWRSMLASQHILLTSLFFRFFFIQGVHLLSLFLCLFMWLLAEERLVGGLEPSFGLFVSHTHTHF